MVLVTGEAVDGCVVSSVGEVAGLGVVGDDVGVDVGDDVAQPASSTPASATVSAKNRSRSMRMVTV